MTLALVVHLAVTWALVGLIWTIQVVHYPLLPGLERDRYPTWQRRHMRRITLVVGPLMVSEGLAAASVLLLAVRGGVERLVSWAGLGLALLVAVWVSTVLLQAPLHGRLAGGFDADSHRRLVRTNWLRTALWTLRGGVAVLLLLRHLPAS